MYVPENVFEMFLKHEIPPLIIKVLLTQCYIIMNIMHGLKGEKGF